MANVITYGVTLDASGAINGFKRLDGAIDANAAKVAKWSTAAKVAGAAIGAALTTAAVLGFKKIIAESSAAQAAQAQLVAALKSTGNAAGFTAGELNAQAKEMQRLTTFSDDAVTSMQSVLLTFTKVGGETFPRATRAIADLATRMGGDLQGAAVQVGKALNDPVQGISALSRVGVSFSDSQKAVIKQLAETNRLAEAQAMILRELETEFGGSAEAARNTLGGALANLSNAWGDLFEVSQESSGGMIRAINAIAASLPKLGEVINTTIDGFVIMFGWTDRIAKFLHMMPQDLAAAASAAKTHGDTVAAAMGSLFGGRGRDAGGGGDDGASERKAAWEDARRNAAERQAWEDEYLRTILAQAKALKALPAPGASAIRLGWQGESFRGLVEGRGVTALPDAMRMAPGLTQAQARAKAEAEIAIQAEMDLAKERELIQENFLRGAQSAFAGFFRDVLTTGTASFRDLMGSFKNLVVSTVAELAAKNLMTSILGGGKGGGAGGFLGGLLKNPLAIGLGVAGFALSGIFGGSRGPSYRANNTPRYDANGETGPQLAAREWLAAQSRRGEMGNQLRQSVGGTLTETSASRIVGNLESIRVGIFRLVALAEAGAMGGATVNVNAAGGSSPGASVAALVDRAMGVTTQRLRLASGAAVIG